MLYEVAPDTAVQETVTWLAPPVAVTPVGAAGMTGAGALVAAVALAEEALSPELFTAVTR